MRVSTSIQCALRVSILTSFAAAGCANDSPPPSATPSRAVESDTVLAKTVKANPANESAAPSTASYVGRASGGQASPQEDHLRYGPRNYVLPAGCGPAGVKFSCNPLTNAGCHQADDEACDDDDHGAFGCDQDSDNVKEGGDCNDKDGPSCAPGMTCDNPSDSDPRGVCRKFCCTKADCPGSKTCEVLDREFGTLGVCK